MHANAINGEPLYSQKQSFSGSKAPVDQRAFPSTAGATIEAANGSLCVTM
jgi:hypothetical protein